MVTGQWNAETPLHLAAHKGKAELVEKLLKLGADPTAENKFNMTALHLAAIGGHVDVVEKLLAWRAPGAPEPDVEEEDGTEEGEAPHKVPSPLINAKSPLLLQMTPVHLAVVGFHTEVLEALIKAGAELDAKYMTSADVLTKANTAVREALANTGLPCEEVSEDDLEYVGKDSYIQAVKAPAQALMAQLVKLLAAASETEMQQGLEAMEKKMVKHGNSLAKIVAAQEKLRPKDKDALEDALEERRVLFLHWKNTHRTIRSLRTMLLARGSGGEVRQTALQHAVMYWNLPGVKALLGARVNVDAQDRASHTALHLTAAQLFVQSQKIPCGDPPPEGSPMEVLQELVQAGAEVDLELHEMLNQMNFGLPTALVFKRSPHFFSELGKSAAQQLYQAVVEGNEVVAKAVLGVEPAVGAADSGELAPLTPEKAKRVHELLTWHHPLEAGSTALHAAVRNSREALVALLIKLMPVLDLCDANGDTPLHVSIKHNRRDIADSLMQVHLTNYLLPDGERGLGATELARMQADTVLVAIIEEHGRNRVRQLKRCSPDLANRAVTLDVAEKVLQLAAQCQHLVEAPAPVPEDPTAPWISPQRKCLAASEITSAQLVEGFINPVTAKAGCSMVQAMINDLIPHTLPTGVDLSPLRAYGTLEGNAMKGKAGTVEVFVSHTWSRAYHTQLAAVRQHERYLKGTGAMPQDHQALYWMDVLAVPPSCAGDMQKSPDSHPDIPLEKCHRLVVVLEPWAAPAAVKRAWCLYEIFYALHLGKEVELVPTAEFLEVCRTAAESKSAEEVGKVADTLHEWIETVDVQEGATRYPADKAFLLKRIEELLPVDEEEKEDSCTQANNVVKAMLFRKLEGPLRAYMCVLERQEEQLRELLEQGVDLNATVTGVLPIVVAIQMRDVEMMDLLVELGARVDSRGFADLQTALHRAVASAAYDCVEALIRLKADLDLQDTNGATPLHLAAVASDLQSVQLLKGAGAKLDLPNKDGLDVRMLAAKVSSDAVAALFLPPPDPKKVKHMSRLLMGRYPESNEDQIKAVLIAAGVDLPMEGDKIKYHEAMERLAARLTRLAMPRTFLGGDQRPKTAPT